MMNDKQCVSLTTNALRKHVLLADDNRNFSFLMRKQLEQVGLRCSIAQNGVEAQQHLLKKPIDVVITDYHMPVMGGLALIQWMHRHHYQVPVILLSGVLQEDIREKVAPQPCTLLKKSCPFSDLYLKILEVFQEPQLAPQANAIDREKFGCPLNHLI
jgi:two-component system chemotaxis response regulator CheY